MIDNETQINIAFASDNNYAQHLCVAIISVLANLDNKFKLNIIILDDSISEDNKSKINKSIGNFSDKVTVKFEKVDWTIFSNYITTSTLPFASYFRILLPEICKDLERILYLDSDLVVEGDISEIYFNKFKNNYLFAVEDPDLATVKNYKSLGINSKNGYFNSGVLLIDLKSFRRDLITKKIFEALNATNNKTDLFDQTALNAALWNSWGRLHLKWNYQADISTQWDFWYMTYKAREIREAKRDIKIIHYAGPVVKPWIYESIGGLKSRYYFYLEKTEFKNFKPNPSFKKLMLRLGYGFVYYVLPRSLFSSKYYRKILTFLKKVIYQ